jgi:hypothetical protein
VVSSLYITGRVFPNTETSGTLEWRLPRITLIHELYLNFWLLSRCLVTLKIAGARFAKRGYPNGNNGTQLGSAIKNIKKVLKVAQDEVNSFA